MNIENPIREVKMEKNEKIWVQRIRYEIIGNLGSDRSPSTYSNQPPTAQERSTVEQKDKEE